MKSVWVFGLVAVVSLSACGDFSADIRTSQKQLGSRAVFGLAQENDANAVARALQNSDDCKLLKAKAAGGADVTIELQKCVDSVRAGETISLPPGTYNVSGTVKITKAITLETAGLPANYRCDFTNPTLSCAEIKALPSAFPEASLGLLAITGEGAVVRHIAINGDRFNRTRSLAADHCRRGANGYGHNVSVNGSKITVSGLVSRFALCGTGMWVKGDRLDIRNNAIVFNGVHDTEGLWADGMTVLDASSSKFTDNYFLDNTDVGFIFGGCQKCAINGNRVEHSSLFVGSSFAAMMLHAWPDGATSGDYTGSDISRNVIDCGPERRCGFGLYLGAESWYSAPLFGGFFHDNIIRNSLGGFMVEKASGPIRIKDNIVESSGGQTWTSRGQIETAYAYNIPDRTNVVIEDTRIPIASYAAVSFSRSIPNFHNKEVNWRQGHPVEPDPRMMESEEYERQQIAMYYREILGRQAAAGEIDHWYKSMVANRWSLAQVRELINQSAESRAPANADPIVDLYRHLLEREPDANGLAIWRAEYAKGMSLETIRNKFLDSEEYKRLQIKKYYRESLKREAAPAEVDHWYKTMIAQGWNLGFVRQQIANSPEAMSKR